MNTWDMQFDTRIELYMYETVPQYHACMHIRACIWASPIRIWDVPYAYIAIIIDQFTLKLQALTVAIYIAS